MKVIITGGKNYKFDEQDKRILNTICKAVTTELFYNGAVGVDKEAKEWADSNNIPVKTFEPEWDRFGQIAGNIRDEQMVEHASLIIVFPGGSETKNIKRLAERWDKPVIDIAHFKANLLPTPELSLA